MLFYNPFIRNVFTTTFSGRSSLNYRSYILLNMPKKRSFSYLPVKVKQYSFLIKILRKFLIIPCLFVLYIRSFFIKDRTHLFLMFFAPFTSAIFILLSNIYPDIFTIFSACYFYLWLGIQLMLYDTLGSHISFHALNDIDPVFSVTTLIVLKNHRNFIIRHISYSVFKSLVIGKTAMSATGRASLIVGTTTGGAWLYNSYRDRQAMDHRAAADRQAMDHRAAADRHAQDQREAKMRAYQNYRDSLHQYNSTPFYKSKPEKPQWKENQWEKWSNPQ